MNHDFARKLTLPPADRAHWSPPASQPGPLLYLAWGERQYGLSPIPPTRHDGWTYVVVESGTPTLVCFDRLERIEPLTLLILGPECAFGWQDEGTRVSRLLVSAWASPQHPALDRLPADAATRFRVFPSELAGVQRLHAVCRAEASRNDRHSPSVLAALQTLVEVQLARIGENSQEVFGDEFVDRALNWIATHLATRQPLARLADYLGVSAATVQRTFQERLGTSVMKTFAELRRREADRLLAQKGMTIKEVAYRLGYRHPHDFSRAYLKQTGQSPRTTK